MARSADPRPYDPPLERVPGDFPRHPTTKAPVVAHPTETTKHGGTKADLIALCAERGIAVPEKATIAVLQGLLGPKSKMVTYGRPSSLGKQIEDQTNLQKWSERMVALGIASDAQLRADTLALAGLQQDSAEFREAADAIARRAKTVAQAHLAAERGTHHHELTEDNDLDRDPVERMARGEQLGVPEVVQRAIVAAWQTMLTRFNIEVLATEALCVDDQWRQAGTLDRIVRLRHDLRFTTVTGEYVTLPAGWTGILDIKTGRLRLDDAGFVAYWLSYSVQLASYAQSRPYDPDRCTRSEWPWPIDQQWAIIAHLDVLAALDGEAVCRLVLVDLAAGRDAGALCVAGKAWEKRKDVFSIPVDELAVRVPVADLPEAPSAPSGTVEPQPVQPAPAPVGDTTDTNAEGAPATSPASDTHAPSAPPPKDQQDAVRSRPTPSEGNPMDAAFDDLQDAYVALGDRNSPARSWIAALTEQASQGGVPFHAKDNRTERRYHIIRALVLLARQGVSDDDVRDLLEPIIGDCAHFSAVPVGHLVGSLDVQEARRFGALVDGSLAIEVAPDGRTRLAA